METDTAFAHEIVIARALLKFRDECPDGPRPRIPPMDLSAAGAVAPRRAHRVRRTMGMRMRVGVMLLFVSSVCLMTVKNVSAIR